MPRIVRKILIVAATLLLLTAAVMAGWWSHLPWDFSQWRQGPPPQAWSTWLRYEQLMARDTGGSGIAYTYVPLEEVALSLQVAVLAAEDIGYFGHRGIDWTAVREALNEWVHGESLRGASTITQQLAKNLFLTDRRSLGRKFREARLARALEQQLGKKRILELYLNVIEFGDRILGVEAASRHYYNVPARRLNPEQAAGLAATIPSPVRNNPDTGTRSWSNRRDIIRGRMDQADWLRKRLLNMYPPAIAAVLDDRTTLPDSLAFQPDSTSLLPDSLSVRPDSLSVRPDSSSIFPDSISVTESDTGKAGIGTPHRRPPDR